MKSRLPLIVLCSVLFTSVSNVQGDDSYNVEASLGYLSSESDSSEYQYYTLQSLFYFSDVNLRHHPYAEAAFLERASGVGVTLSKLATKGDSDTVTGGFNLGYHLPDSPLVISGAYARAESQYDSPSNLTADRTMYDLGLGYYLSDGLLLSARYLGEEHTLNDLNLTIDVEGYDVEVKSVSELSGDTAINLQGQHQQRTYDDGTDKTKYTATWLMADYYFNRRFSLGARVARIAGDVVDETTLYGLNSRYFFNNKLSAHIGVDTSEKKNTQGSNNDSFSFTLSSRF